MQHDCYKIWKYILLIRFQRKIILSFHTAGYFLKIVCEECKRETCENDDCITKARQIVYVKD